MNHQNTVPVQRDTRMMIRSISGAQNPPLHTRRKPGVLNIIHSPVEGELVGHNEPSSPTSASTSPTTVKSNGCSSIIETSISQMANIKEKTPMCLINELARYNKSKTLRSHEYGCHLLRYECERRILPMQDYAKIAAIIEYVQHQYRLTNEQGPAHKKRFTVTLKLGEEEYAADGPSIKKAQHSAASEALVHTKYKHPPPKSTRGVRIGRNNITPTVELNALAMKRGEPAVYNFLELPHNGNPAYVNGPPPTAAHTYNYRTVYNQCYQYKPSTSPYHSPMFMVSLRVGPREFFGEGPTAQAARHDAASKALSVLKSYSLPDDSSHCETGYENGLSCVTPDPTSELKSPISLVHEIALKRNMAVNFEVISEKGPPHMKTFITKCTVGDKMTTGEGNGKKVSKKRAAEKMLEELKKLPPTSPTNLSATVARLKRKTNPNKKKTRNLIKVVQEKKTEPEYTDDINPISRLIQIQQAKKEREPVYSLVEERGVPRRKEFVMEVSVGQASCTGTGPNKKLAKRAAAEGLLQQLGYSRTSGQPPKSAIKGSSSTENPPTEGEKPRKVTFVDEEKVIEISTGGSSGRQLVPGLILMSESVNNMYSQTTPVKTSGLNVHTTATCAKELLNGGCSPTAEALAKNHGRKPEISVMEATSTQQNNTAVRPKDQLLYLADLLGFKVQFSDFPKGNHSEFLSLVSLSTEPPQVCHGSGSTIEMSHDQAALTALIAMSEMGLDSVTASGGLQKEKTQGEGHHGAIQKSSGHTLRK